MLALTTNIWFLQYLGLFICHKKCRSLKNFEEEVKDDQKNLLSEKQIMGEEIVRKLIKGVEADSFTFQ